MSVPISTCRLPKLCRVQWKVIFLVIPAAVSHRWSGPCSILSLKPSKISPSPRSPNSPQASSLIGLCTISLVFCIRVVTNILPLVYGCICCQVSCLMSLFLNPVRQAKRKALFNTSSSQGVSASRISSSWLKCSLMVGMHSMRSKKAVWVLLYLPVTVGGMQDGTES